MKTATLETGTIVNYHLEQDDNMVVIVYSVDTTTGKRSLAGRSFGVRKDIDDIDVQGQIAQELLMPFKDSI